LQGAPLPASILETDILAARLEQYEPGDLDAVIGAGEVVWVGVEPLGERDGRVALYLADHLPRLLPPRIDERPAPSSGARKPTPRTPAPQIPTPPAPGLPARESALVEWLAARGASFFAPLHEAAGGGYPAETVDALWNLVWQGLVTNDGVHALRAFTKARVTSRRRADRHASTFRSRRLVPRSAEGRWALVRPLDVETTSARGTIAAQARTRQQTTSWAAAATQQLLSRHGVVTRESIAAETLPGGFGPVYTVMKAMEESGRIRRGYFVAGLGATQFAMPAALDLLRSMRDTPEDAQVVTLAATDPANPYGATLKWPGLDAAHGRGPTRTVGASVILVDGALCGYLARGERMLLAWVPDTEPQRTRVARAVARALVERARSGGDTPRGMLIEELNGVSATLHPLASFCVEAGFTAGAMGLAATRARTS
ncbi:MAG: DEAD/DEAH box helicase, partial [Vicinamibacterales bacterium]